MVDSQSYFVSGALDDGIPEDHYSRFLVRFVDEFFPVLGIEEKKNKPGRPSLPVREMFKLILYAYSCNVTDPNTIWDNCLYHKIYAYVSNGIKPSERSIRKFIGDYGYLFDIFLGCTLFFANELGITDFKHLSVDGTIKKAYNSRYNVLNEKEIDLLLGFYSGSVIPRKKIKKLSRPAQKLMERTDLSDEDKLELLKTLKKEIMSSGQRTVPVNDVEARWMHNKKNYEEISQNVQSAVDTISKLICAIKVTKGPTDHNELPEIVKKAIENIGYKPDYVSADTGYHTETSFQYLEKENIEALIPDRKQTRKNRGKLSENPFHKDHFEYDAEKDIYICPNQKELSLKYKITTKTNDNRQPDKIERRYMNYTACKSCDDLNKCCKGNARQITEFGSTASLETKAKMETSEYKELFKERSSTVEAPFGTLKTYYKIDNLPITGIERTEHYLSLFAVVYNLKVLFNKINNIFSNQDDIKYFMDQMRLTLSLDCKITEK